MRTALVVGEALIDLVQHPGKPPAEHVGGSPLNVAVGLARLGRDVEFLTSLGDDPLGRRIAAYLRDGGVTLAAHSVDAARTATALARIDENGSATYQFDIRWAPSADADAAAPLVLFTGSIAVALRPGCDTVRDLIDAHAASATVVLDPNIRPAFFAERTAARTHIESFVARADVVKASDEDMRWLAPDLDPEELAAAWLALGPAIVAVTSGTRGAHAICRRGAVRVPAYPARVVDTVGAGDSFTAGLTDALWGAGLLGAANRKSLRDISTGTLGEMLRFGALSAALTVASPGAALPDLAVRERAAQRLGLRSG